MSVTVTYNPQLSVAEVPSLGEDLVANPTLTHVISGLNATYTGSSTVPVAYVWSDNASIPAAPFTNSYDFAALTRTVLTALDVTGTKLQFIQFIAGTANTGTVTLEPAAVEGYNLFGASGEVTLKAGQHILFFGNEQSDEITNNTDDKIQVVGTVENDTYKIIMVFG